jgi:hypothetical protein
MLAAVFSFGQQLAISRELPRQVLLGFSSHLPPYDPCWRQADHLTGPLLFCTKGRMPQKSSDIRCCFSYYTTDHYDAVIMVTKPAMKKSFITGHKGHRFQMMEIVENFFEILPLWTAYLTTNLLSSNRTRRRISA